MKGCLTRFVVLLALVGLFFYLALPALAEHGISRQLHGALGTPTPPEVEVTSSFPPELLLGRIDRIKVSADRMTLQGAAFSGGRADLRGGERLGAGPPGRKPRRRGPTLLPDSRGARGPRKPEQSVPRLPGLGQLLAPRIPGSRAVPSPDWPA